MTKEEILLSKHLKDLAESAWQKGIAVFSDFLNLNEQNVYHSLSNSLSYIHSELFGGYDFAERQMAGFFPDGFEAGISSAFPIRAVYMPNEVGVVRVMVSVSKRYFKRAVKRNRIKRQLREAYRLQKESIVEKGEEVIDRSGIRNECLRYNDEEPEASAARQEDADAWHKMSDKLIAEFTKIAKLGMSEYEYVPPNKYFRDGFNLCKRMKASPEEYTLFLKDPSVPPTNNLAERCARKYKRKAHQMMSFRGDHGDEYFCDALSILETLRLRKLNLFKEVSSRFALP